ncbi:MAG: PKD domain-containing protein, partial [Flavobacteriales bacterium]
CGALSTTFTIEAPAALEVEASAAMASCPATADGGVDLTVLGGTAPYTYLWSDGSTEEDLTAAAGVYTVTITDDRGCTVFTPEFTIAAGEAPVALAEVSSTTTLVNTPVTFTNTSTEGDSYLWAFGDGQFSTEFAPEHTWTVPGTYTVTLTVDNGSCSSTWTAQVVVETSTSISSTTATDAVNVWFANDKFVVEHGISNGLPVLIDVLDATGRLHSTRQVAGSPAGAGQPPVTERRPWWPLRAVEVRRRTRHPLPSTYLRQDPSLHHDPHPPPRSLPPPDRLHGLHHHRRELHLQERRQRHHGIRGGHEPDR